MLLFVFCSYVFSGSFFIDKELHFDRQVFCFVFMAKESPLRFVVFFFLYSIVTQHCIRVAST